MSEKLVSENFVLRRLPDGHLEYVGDFEGLYRHEKEPWGQSGTDPRLADYYPFSRSNIARSVKLHCKTGTLLEVGCGLGYALNHLVRCNPEWIATGMDISPTAVNEASFLFPNLSFFTGDIRSPLETKSTFDVIVLNQILWYILKELDQVFINCRSVLKADGLLVISTGFLRQQHYGTEIINGFNGLLSYLLHQQKEAFQIVEAHYDHSHRYLHHDGIVLLRKT
jgi:SAM-dependent methyltransferase